MKETEAWSLYADRSANGRFPIEHDGVHRYDGKTSTNSHRAQGLASEGIQAIFEEKAGRIRLGSVFELVRYDGKSIPNVSKKGVGSDANVCLFRPLPATSDVELAKVLPNEADSQRPECSWRSEPDC